MVYLKQEKFQSAEFHFTKATTIFRTNPDLICHLAVVSALLDFLFLSTDHGNDRLGATQM